MVGTEVVHRLEIGRFGYMLAYLTGNPDLARDKILSLFFHVQVGSLHHCTYIYVSNRDPIREGFKTIILST